MHAWSDAQAARSAAGQDSEDAGGLSQYLAWVRRFPVLDREQASVLSETIRSREHALRESLYAIPGTAALVLGRWHERREAGRMTGLLAHGYHDNVKHDWSSHIDGHLRAVEHALTKWRALPSRASAHAADRAQVEKRIAGRLAKAEILLEILLEILDEMLEWVEAPPTASGRKRLRALGLSKRAARKHLRAAAEARDARDEARQRFAQHNLRLVVKLAKRYRSFGLPYLDLIQEGNKGLMRAVDKFDHTRGFTFSTYGVWWIEQALIRAVQNSSRTVRVPSHIYQEQREYRSVEESLRRTLLREPYLEEIAAELGWTNEEAERIAACMSPIRSIDDSLGEEGGTTWADRLEAPEEPEPCLDMDRASIRAVLDVGLSGLPERQRLVLEWRFGLRGEESMTLKEIGERIGLSRERVRQIQTQALGQLRERADVGRLAAQLDSWPDAA